MQDKTTTNNRQHLLIILVWFLFLTGLLVFRLSYHGGFIPEWDEAHHSWMGLKYYRAFLIGNVDKIFDLFKYSDQIYPPLYHILIAVAYKIFGVSATFGSLANIPFILILMLSLYGLGGIMGNKKAGLVAALLTPVLPVFLNLQEKVLIDYASISMFVASFYVLFKTEGFTNTKYSVLFGLMIFLDILIKWPFAIPGIPFLVYAAVSFIKNKPKRKLVFINILISFLILLPALSWYWYNYPYMLKAANYYWDPNGYVLKIWGFPTGLTISNLIHYLYTYPSSQRGVGSLILIFFLVFLVIKKSNKKLNYLVGSIVVTYVVLTILNDKSPYYIGYTYPLLMLITTIGIDHIKNLKIKYKVSFLFCGLILFNFILTSLNPIKTNQIIFYTTTNMFSVLPNYASKFAYSQKWPTEAFAKEYINEEICSKGLLVFPDNRFLNVVNLRYYLSLHNKNVLVSPAYLYYDPSSNTSTIATNDIEKFDCVITKSKESGEFANQTVVDAATKYLDSQKQFTKQTFKVPDKTTVNLYIRNQDE